MGTYDEYEDPHFVPDDSPEFIQPPAQDSGMDASGPTDRNAPPQPDVEWPEGWDDDADA
jgi:hypothetical protein